MLNLDTHILLGFVAGTASADELRCAGSDELAISDIVLWEIAKLMQKGRITFDPDNPHFRAWLRSITVLPITPKIAWQSTRLDFSSDPADEIIAATSVVEKIPLLTRDQRIRTSRLVPLAL
ncbi:MAG TPA: type II toxin-antitoxin system VapC family toxin [Terriglobia bacterium]|nr:type II toxin-antitoxin system VapC family toxin [Terriglobia bacterium]